MIKKLLGFWFLGLASGWGALEWDRLPNLPDREGFAGVFSGVVSENGEDFLVVAGGANFPNGRPWEGGKKIYYDDIFVLPLKDGGEWRKSEAKLPAKMGYGMSVSLERGVALFMGGKNEAGERDDLIHVSIRDGKLNLDSWGVLPRKIAEGAAAVVAGKVVLGAGVSGGKTSLESFVLEEFNPKEVEWKSLGWPEGARGRMYPVAGARGGKFYLLGGRDNADSEEEKEDRIFGLDFLKDAWELNVASGQWKRLADMPEARSAAPSQAVPVGVSSFLMLGGVTVDFLREQVAARPELSGQGMEHPGFPGSVLSYNTVTDRWAEAGSFPMEGRLASPHHD